jgi:hypothetical protein
MCGTMSEEHACMVVEAIAAGQQYVTSPDYNLPTARLARRCLDALHKGRHWPYTEIPDEVAFAMPPVVAQVYLEHDALPLHECEDCGYKIPITPGTYRGTGAIRHFDSCPLCGGRVGWYAYWKRRTEEAKAK